MKVQRFTPVLAFVAICWLVLAADIWVCGGRLTQYGILPRHVAGLPGILWAPFLHVSSQHLAANTLPLLLLGGILCARSRGEFITVAVAGTLITGGFIWLVA